MENLPNKRTVELRSEKVRNIIGTVPSKLVRYGISVVSLIIIMLIVGSKYFTFQGIIKSDVFFIKKSDSLKAIIPIPLNQVSQINNTHTAFVLLTNIESLPNERIKCKIDSISFQSIISKNKAYRNAVVHLPNTLQTSSSGIVNIYGDSIKLKVEIPLKEISFFDKIFPKRKFYK